MAHGQPSTHFNIGKRINACGITGYQWLVNENKCHALHYRGLAYQSSRSRQAQEILVCDVQSRHDDNIYRKKERLKASTTEHCTQHVRRHAVLSEWARQRRT
eukprot:3153466-Pleurochrysis_carterae.AAC.1